MHHCRRRVPEQAVEEDEEHEDHEKSEGVPLEQAGGDHHDESDQHETVFPTEVGSERVDDEPEQRAHEQTDPGPSPPPIVPEDVEANCSPEHVLENPMEQEDVTPGEQSVDEDQLGAGQERASSNPVNGPDAPGSTARSRKRIGPTNHVRTVASRAVGSPDSRTRRNPRTHSPRHPIEAITTNHHGNQW